MPKRSPFILAALALILAACSGQPPATPTATLSPTATTPPTAAAEPTTAASPAASPVAVADCTVTSFVPTPDATEISLFPAPGEDDHVLGEDTAAVTFTEYSDFQ